jgi:hypothetical protein
MRTVILLPWRSDNGWREKLWAHCHAVWEREFPDWPIYIGLSDDGPFQRSQAINRAAEAAGEWDVALIIDGDTISDPQAVRAAVAHAHETGALAIAHRARLMLTKHATHQVLAGRKVPASDRRSVSRVWQDSVSCAVAVSRKTWELVDGFDERFIGWGFEDTAFYVACETLTGKPGRFEQAECLHLWHESQPEANKQAPTYIRNQGLRNEYEQAHWDPPRMRAILAGVPAPPGPPTTIPRILHRTVPAQTPEQVEQWWEMFRAMHPTWDLRTYRDPIDPADWPLTGDLFDKCGSGAQKAGLIRLEALYTHGGVYVDSDVEPVRPLDPLLELRAFAGWEDENVVPDAILGCEPEHPAFKVMLTKARAAIEAGADPWTSGPGVTTSTLPRRNDVLLLPPGSFYPVHYREKTRLGTRNDLPWVFAEHKWHHSWDPKKQAPAAVKIEAVKEEWNGIYICIPWRDGADIRRRQAYKWCVNYWQHHGFEVVTGTGQSRAEMCNDAAALAIEAGADVLVFADADTWAAPEQVAAAVTRARESNALVHAYDVYARVGAGETAQAIRVPAHAVKPQRLAARGAKFTEHVSGLLAVSVELWDRVGGFDERFIKWGFEDHAFDMACQLLGDGPPGRVPGPAIHWHHRADPTKAQNIEPETLRLIAAYCAAAGRVPTSGRTAKLARSGLLPDAEGWHPDPIRMRAVLAEEGGPLSGKVAVQ